MSQWVESALPGSDTSKHKSGSTHWNYCQTVLRNHTFNLYTLYLIRFWYLLSDAVNGSWSKCGNWVSEKRSDFSRATQLIRGKARFHLMSVSAAGSSPVGHGKRISFPLWLVCDYLNFHKKYRRRSQNSRLLLGSHPLDPVHTIPSTISSPPTASRSSSAPQLCLGAVSQLNGGHSSMFPKIRDRVFQLGGLNKLPCHYCPIQTERSESVSSRYYDEYEYLITLLKSFFHFYWEVIDIQLK